MSIGTSTDSIDHLANSGFAAFQYVDVLFLSPYLDTAVPHSLQTTDANSVKFETIDGPGGLVFRGQRAPQLNYINLQASVPGLYRLRVFIEPNTDKNAAGVVALPNGGPRIAARAYQQVGQAIPNNANTAVVLDGGLFINYGGLVLAGGNTLLQVPPGGDGLYWVHGQVYWNAPIAGRYMTLLLATGGAVVSQSELTLGGAAAFLSVSTEGLYPLVGGNQIQLSAFQLSGGAQNTQAGATSLTYLEVLRVY